MNNTTREPPRPWIQSARERGGAARLFLMYRTAGAEERKVVIFNRSLAYTALGDGVAPADGRMRVDFLYFGQPYGGTQRAVAPAQGSEGWLRPFFGTEASQRFNCDIYLLF